MKLVFKHWLTGASGEMEADTTKRPRGMILGCSCIVFGAECHFVTESEDEQATIRRVTSFQEIINTLRQAVQELQVFKQDSQQWSAHDDKKLARVEAHIQCLEQLFGNDPSSLYLHDIQFLHRALEGVGPMHQTREQLKAAAQHIDNKRHCVPDAHRVVYKSWWVALEDMLELYVTWAKASHDGYWRTLPDDLQALIITRENNPAPEVPNSCRPLQQFLVDNLDSDALPTAKLHLEKIAQSLTQMPPDTSSIVQELVLQQLSEPEKHFMTEADTEDVSKGILNQLQAYSDALLCISNPTITNQAQAAAGEDSCCSGHALILACCPTAYEKHVQLPHVKLEAAALRKLLEQAGYQVTIGSAPEDLKQFLDRPEQHKLVLMLGHGDLEMREDEFTWGFTDAKGVFQTVDNDTIADIFGQHTDSIAMVVLAGCKTFKLGDLVSRKGVESVVCCGTKFLDKAAPIFNLALNKGWLAALSSGKSAREAARKGFEQAKLAVEGFDPQARRIGKSQSGKITAGVPAYALEDPNGHNIVHPQSHPDPQMRVITEGRKQGRIAVGVPKLLQRLESRQIVGMPLLKDENSYIYRQV